MVEGVVHWGKHKNKVGDQRQVGKESQDMMTFEELQERYIQGKMELPKGYFILGISPVAYYLDVLYPERVQLQHTNSRRTVLEVARNFIVVLPVTASVACAAGSARFDLLVLTTPETWSECNTLFSTLGYPLEFKGLSKKGQFHNIKDSLGIYMKGEPWSITLQGINNCVTSCSLFIPFTFEGIRVLRNECDQMRCHRRNAHRYEPPG